ncbi:TauD/TfdA dioxygenase family protein [Spirillospora sp. CA-294931]|uniref:TauD/TfdA dioxygenase family protein n=1 Tax=Spirillospora sp. CA-294931 TaxID=3240042 RepID=UPI003D8ED02D
MPQQILDPVHPDTANLEITPVGGRIGAVVGGVALSGALDDALVAGIRAALLRHKVIFFRGQDHLDADGQVAFARRLGDLTAAHPTVPSLDGQDHVLDLDYEARGAQGANHWHTDVTFLDRPPLASVLRAVTLPDRGGDTQWANTVAAYETLSPELRELADRLWAVHNNQFDYVLPPQATDRQRAHAEIFSSVQFETEHPVVRVHPETGERSLLLGGFARRLAGQTREASADLIKLFQDHITRPEHVVRWRWTPGDVAIWDNRATQHQVVADFDRPRRLQRVTVTGDVPVSVDGRTSVALKGDSADYTGHAHA